MMSNLPRRPTREEALQRLKEDAESRSKLPLVSPEVAREQLQRMRQNRQRREGSRAKELGGGFLMQVEEGAVKPKSENLRVPEEEYQRSVLEGRTMTPELKAAAARLREIRLSQPRMTFEEVQAQFIANQAPMLSDPGLSPES